MAKYLMKIINWIRVCQPYESSQDVMVYVSVCHAINIDSSLIGLDILSFRELTAGKLAIIMII